MSDLICGVREVRGPAVCTRESGHARDVHEQQVGLGVLRWAVGDEDIPPTPDGAVPDVYREAAEAWWTKVEEDDPLTPLEKLNMEMVFDCEMTHEACVTRLSGDAPFRAAIDKARELWEASANANA